MSVHPLALSARHPEVPAGRLVAELVPPPRFDEVRFGSYVPDPARPTQRQAVKALEAFAALWHALPAAPERNAFAPSSI
ncbi:hypothetical protein [Streptomyces sp. 6N223]|uniref:hypothetical protein n=1 Tax=Streptomyces sp. 6N223 TaxID=3457412 RepID=UPI003FD3EB9D